jgi:hypothetical protein
MLAVVLTGMHMIVLVVAIVTHGMTVFADRPMIMFRCVIALA